MESTYTVCTDVSHQRVDETVFLLDLASGEYFSLNATGAVIWGGLADGRELGDILDALVECYGAAADRERLQGDLLELVDELESRRLIRRSSANGTG